VTVARTPAAIAGTSEEQQQQPPTATRAAVPCPSVGPGLQTRAPPKARRVGVAPKRNRAGPCHQQSCHRGGLRAGRAVRLVTPRAWRSAAGLLARRTSETQAHTDVIHKHVHTYTRHTHTRPRSLDYSIVDSARAHTDGRQFAVCACSVTVFAVAAGVAVRRRIAVPHPNNHCSLSGSILLFVVICRERARQFGVYNNPSPVVSLSPLS